MRTKEGIGLTLFVASLEGIASASARGAWTEMGGSKMKFFNARIVTKQVPLGAALKAESKPARTLDEILADIQQKGQVKTAAAVAPQVKTAAVKLRSPRLRSPRRRRPRPPRSR